jgi:hypothetical protein
MLGRVTFAFEGIGGSFSSSVSAHNHIAQSIGGSFVSGLSYIAQSHTEEA